MSSLTKEQAKSKLINAGIGAKYTHLTVAETVPKAKEYALGWKEWLPKDKHIVYATDGTHNMLVFAGAVFLASNYDTYVIDTALLVHALQNRDTEILNKVDELDVLGLTGFYDSSLYECPFSAWQLRLLEGFLGQLSRDQSTSFILDVDKPEMKWYSDRFRSLIKMDSIEILQ
ncbi:MAG: hypothetical protein ABW007_19460 [Chitinophagaceae bacterium]